MAVAASSAAEQVAVVACAEPAVAGAAAADLAAGRCYCFASCLCKTINNKTQIFLHIVHSCKLSFPYKIQGKLQFKGL